MPLQRHFLDWDAPLTERVCAWLLPARLAGPADLRTELIVVPTRQAGRRLREALARYCAAQQTALLAGRVVTPGFFFESRVHPDGAASAALVAAAWAAVLRRLDPRVWRELFPTPPPERTLEWALRLGARLQQLRETLADGGWRIAEVPAAAGAALEEPARWQELARLEDAFLRVLAGVDREDPCARKLRLAEAPELPPDIRRIVIAGVPDPSGLALRALGHLSRRLAVDILIHAPAELADHFDDWGRPLPEAWTRRLLAIPEPERNIRSATTPAGQAAAALEILREETTRFDTAHTSTGLSAGLAVGVPDAALRPFLESALAQAGVPTFDPAGIPLRNTELFQAIAALCRLHTEASYAAFSEAIRQADVLDYIQRRVGVAAAELLSALDEFHSRHLPQTWRALRQRSAALVPPVPAAAPAEAREPRPTHHAEQLAPLALVIQVLEELLAPLGQPDPLAGLRQVLLTLYAGRVLPAGAPAARRFAAAAAAVDAALHELAELPDELGDRPDRLALLLQRLEAAVLEPTPAAEAVDLEGWLELPWNDAPLMIVTGVNEGHLPESRLGDLFLPDSLRHSLHVRDNESRYARDAYLLASLLASRRTHGRLVLISGRTSAEGDPLKPSRLLFRCPDAELAARARRLLGERPAGPRGVPSPADPALRRDAVQASSPQADSARSPQASFKLNPCPAGAPDTAAFLQQPLPVTAFRNYLACPFRFYLRRVLRMEALDDQATALDAAGFGELLHTALQHVLLQPERRACAQADVLAEELGRAAAACARGRWGPQLPPLIALQLEIAGQRLRAAARVQADLARQGWEIQACEQQLEFEIDGVTLRARVDRLDRHRATGAWRIVDYKTADRSAQPPEAHLGRARDDTPAYALTADGKQRWLDLQLPLYLHALPPEHQPAAELAYFNLPKAVEDTALEVWQDFSAPLRQSAETCARGVLADIRAGRFWPSAENMPNDDFERLFTGAPEDCFQAELLGGISGNGRRSGPRNTRSGRE